jgi:fibronectin type 3 domain-containing protein
MNLFLLSIRGPLNLLGAFVLLIAGTCLLPASDAGQLKSTSNTSTQSSSVQAETGTLQSLRAAKEAPSCTPEMSSQGDSRPSSHGVVLSWKASTSPGVVGYNLYRRDKTSETFRKINQKPVATLNCVDYFVQLGHTYYYYVVTADRPGVRESGSSNIAPAEIPPQ